MQYSLLDCIFAFTMRIYISNLNDAASSLTFQKLTSSIKDRTQPHSCTVDGDFPKVAEIDSDAAGDIALNLTDTPVLVFWVLDQHTWSQNGI